MTIELKDYILNSGAALVLHAARELVDADLAQLLKFSEQQRAVITSVVLSSTAITGECFRYLAYLPNLKALYANKTRINDDAPLEYLPKTVEILNLDHTEVGDMCVSKLRILPNLHTVRLRKTGVTNRGINILATVTSLRECHFDGTAVSEHARQRLSNAIDLHVMTFSRFVCFLLYRIQLGVRKLILRVGDVRICVVLQVAITRWLPPLPLFCGKASDLSVVVGGSSVKDIGTDRSC